MSQLPVFYCSAIRIPVAVICRRTVNAAPEESSSQLWSLPTIMVCSVCRRSFATEIQNCSLGLTGAIQEWSPISHGSLASVKRAWATVLIYPLRIEWPPLPLPFGLSPRARLRLESFKFTPPCGRAKRRDKSQ